MGSWCGWLRSPRSFLSGCSSRTSGRRDQHGDKRPRPEAWAWIAARASTLWTVPAAARSALALPGAGRPRGRAAGRGPATWASPGASPTASACSREVGRTRGGQHRMGTGGRRPRVPGGPLLSGRMTAGSCGRRLASVGSLASHGQGRRRAGRAGACAGSWDGRLRSSGSGMWRQDRGRGGRSAWTRISRDGRRAPRRSRQCRTGERSSCSRSTRSNGPTSKACCGASCATSRVCVIPRSTGRRGRPSSAWTSSLWRLTTRASPCRASGTRTSARARSPKRSTRSATPYGPSPCRDSS